MPPTSRSIDQSRSAPTARDRVAENFSAWERETGRGLQIFEDETDLEPPFVGFRLNRENPQLIDDGRIPNRIGRLFSRQGYAVQIPNLNVPETLPAAPPLPHSVKEERTVSIRAFFPQELKATDAQTGQLISSLALSASTVSFEIIGTHDEIAFQITCAAAKSKAIISHLRTQFPQIDFRVCEDAIVKNFDGREKSGIVAVDFGLGKEWFLPLPYGEDFTTDPMTPLFAVLDSLGGSEAVCFQVHFGRTRHPWQRSVRENILDHTGKPLFANLQNRINPIKEKLASPILAACVRLLILSDSYEGSIGIARQMGAYLKQFSGGGRNELFPIQADRVDHEKHVASMLARTTYRSGMLVTPSELSAIVRFPSDAIKSDKLGRDQNRTKAGPPIAAMGTIVLGENEHAGSKQVIKVSPASHSLVIGGTGTGKSTLLLNEMVQSIERGSGLCLVDPHGDLVDDVAARIPDNRINDVILFNPADELYPIGFNILQANSDTEKNFLASDLVATFRSYSTSWGDVMDSVLANAVLAFVESTRGGTLLDLKRFLVEKEFRSEFLGTVRDEAVRYFWTHEFPVIGGRTQSSVLIRLDGFLRQKLVRNIVCQRGPGLDLRRVLDERKILLVKLAQGLIGEQNAALLGTLLISKLYQIALTRADIDPSKRSLFPCFIDEAAHFVGNPSMALILANLRKFGIALTLATQNYKQIQDRGDKNIAEAVLANCQARVCFRLGDNDAEKLAGGFSFFDAKALQNLGVGEAIVRIERAEYDFNLKTYPAAPVDKHTSDRRKAAIIEHSRATYATRVEEVEAQLQSARGISTSIPTGDATVRPQYGRAEHSEGTKASSANETIGTSEAETDVVRISDPGKGGQHHRELQTVIKRMAETNGFTAEIEKSVLDGAGSVDVSLENESVKIACEVSVTTVDYETNNVQKCLAAGFDHVVVVVSNRKKIPLIGGKLDAEIPTDLRNKVKVLSLMDLFAFLREQSGVVEPSQKQKKSGGQRLSFADACELLDKSPSTLYRWLREGRVPFYRVGREYEFDRDEILLVGRHDLSAKRKATVKLSPLNIEKSKPKTKKEQDARYRKLLKLD